MGLQTDAVAAIRANLNEAGINTGYWDNATHIYVHMTSVERVIINAAFKYQKRMQKENPEYECSLLEALHKTVGFTLANNTETYDMTTAGVTDYRLPYLMEIKHTTGGTYREAAKVSERERKNRKNHADKLPTVNYPVYSITSTEIGIYPPVTAGSVSAGGKITYYKDTPNVTSGQDLTLRSECYNAIVFGTTALCLEQDQRTEESKVFMEMFQTELAGLLI